MAIYEVLFLDGEIVRVYKNVLSTFIKENKGKVYSYKKIA